MIVRRFLILLGFLASAAALVSSCRDASPVGVDARTPSLLAGRGTPTGDDGDEPPDIDESEHDSLVACRALRYDSVTQTIGPAGGIIEVRRYNWLIVPPGALREPVQITAVAPSETVAMVRFKPEGLRFEAAALLVVTYDQCRVPNGVIPRIALVTDAFHVLEFLTPADASLGDSRLKKAHDGRHVMGELRHFSNYAVAW